MHCKLVAPAFETLSLSHLQSMTPTWLLFLALPSQWKLEALNHSHITGTLLDDNTVNVMVNTTLVTPHEQTTDFRSKLFIHDILNYRTTTFLLARNLQTLLK